MSNHQFMITMIIWVLSILGLREFLNEFIAKDETEKNLVELLTITQLLMILLWLLSMLGLFDEGKLRWIRWLISLIFPDLPGFGGRRFDFGIVDIQPSLWTGGGCGGKPLDIPTSFTFPGLKPGDIPTSFTFPGLKPGDIPTSFTFPGLKPGDIPLFTGGCGGQVGDGLNWRDYILHSVEGGLNMC